MLIFNSIFALSLLVNAAVFKGPEPLANNTPGRLCTTSDSDYSHKDYPEKIARCDRNFSMSDKKKVAEQYGALPESQWDKYEFDHLIPLCAGGSNDIKNVWPQLLTAAKEKDILEIDICISMRSGEILQSTAVRKIKAWFNNKPLSDFKVDDIRLLAEDKDTIRCIENQSTGVSPMIVEFKTGGDSKILGFKLFYEHSDKKFPILNADELASGQAMRAGLDKVLEIKKLRFQIKTADTDFQINLPTEFAKQTAFNAEFSIDLERDGDFAKTGLMSCRKP
jgi:hypothetical protein